MTPAMMLKVRRAAKGPPAPEAVVPVEAESELAPTA